MMIDVHTHLWPLEQTPDYLKSYFTGRDKKSDGYELTCEGLLESMDEAGIDLSIVFALAFSPSTTNTELEKANQYVLEQCEKSNGRLVPFCTINPFEEKAGDYLKRYMEQDGFVGLKLHCNMQQFFPNDERLYPIYRVMEEYGKPVLFHSGGIGVNPNKDRFGQPVNFDDIACDFPELPIILGHAGRIWYNETAMLLRKHKNVFAEISTNIGRAEELKTMPLKDLFRIVKGWAGSTEHLMFGSDYPFYGQKETVDVLRRIQQENKSYATPKEIEAIIKINAQVFCQRYGVLRGE